MLRPTVAALAVLGATVLLAPAAHAAPGDLDPAFSGDGLAQAPGAGTSDLLLRQPDGKLVVVTAGRFPLDANPTEVRRFTAGGVPDVSFSGDGLVTLPVAQFRPLAVMRAADGRLLIATATSHSEFDVVAVSGTGDVVAPGRGVPWPADGQSSGAAVFAPDGSASFSVAVLTVPGDANAPTRLGAVRLKPDGAADTTFSGDGLALEAAGEERSGFSGGIVRDGQGRVVVVAGGRQALRAVRFTAAGEQDPGYAAPGPQSSNVPFGIRTVIDAAGRVVVATGSSGSNGFSVQRLLADGGGDEAVGLVRVQASASNVGDLALDGAGRVLLTGGSPGFADGAPAPASGSRAAVVRLSADLRLDRTWGGGDGVAEPVAGDAFARGLAVAGSQVLVAVQSSRDDAVLAALQAPPEAVIAPDTEITGGTAEGATVPDDATYTFRAPGTDAVAFECRLEPGSGAPGGPLWRPCVSPTRTEDGLRVGVNTFRVRSVTAAGAVDPTPAARSFTYAPGSEPPATAAPPATSTPPPATPPPAAPPIAPPPVVPAAARVALAATTLDRARRVLRAPVTATAAGRVVVTVRGRLPGARRTTTLGRATRTVVAGRRTVVRVRLGAAARRALRSRSLRTTVQAVLTPARGGAAVRGSRSAILRRAAR